MYQRIKSFLEENYYLYFFSCDPRILCIFKDEATLHRDWLMKRSFTWDQSNALSNRMPIC